MPKKISIVITEDLAYLEKAHQKASGGLKKDRIKALIYVRSAQYQYQSEIAKKLGRTEKTIRCWLQDYAAKGFEGLTTVKSGGNNTRTISPEVISFIAEKLKAKDTVITSYIEFQALIAEEFGSEIAYGALYSHCRRQHRSKLKVARKSHHKKDEQAGELFKKPQKSV